MFACTVNEPDLNLTLIIDDTLNSDKLQRVNATAFPNSTHGFVYIFEDVLPSDNGTTFFCMASNINSTHNDTFVSDILTLQVLGQ